MSDAVTQDSWFEEIDRFDPVAYMNAQYCAYAYGRALLWKTVLDDTDSLETNLLDGILEPLSIRILPSFWAGTTPIDPHITRGALLDGNEDAAGSSDLIETIYAWDVNSEFSPFVDANHALDGTILINGNFRADRVALSPFFDRRLIRNVASGSYYLTASVALTPVEVALSPMTGSTDNYIASGERSATCGWDYDSNTSIGTDSLAFGGFRY